MTSSSAASTLSVAPTSASPSASNHRQPLPPLPLLSDNNAAQPQPSDAESAMASALLSRLMEAHEKRAVAVATSRRLLAEMKDTKQWLRQWMMRYRLGELAPEDAGRKFVRKKRKVYKSVNVDTVLEWVEADFGVSERRRYEERIKRTKKSVLREVDEYKITFSGVRKRGEHNPGAMPTRKRPRSNES